MTGRPWMKWYPGDWRGDPLVRSCDPIARYVWMEMIGLMHEAEPYGHLVIGGRAMDIKVLSQVIAVDLSTVRQAVRLLENRGVFSRNDEGVIFSRRMVRDEERSAEARTFGQAGGNRKLMREYNRSGFLYVMGVRSDGAYKVGISTNPTNRVKKVRAQYRGQDISVLAQWPTTDMGATEADLHRFLRENLAKSNEGEWFFLNPPDIEKIGEMVGTLKGRLEGRPEGHPQPQRPEARKKEEEARPLLDTPREAATPRPPPAAMPDDLRQVMQAASMTSPPSDATLLRDWQAAGISLDDTILPNVRRLAERETERGRPVGKLKYFDQAIREEHAEDQRRIEHYREVSRRYAEG
jgi:hypothetical protein